MSEQTAQPEQIAIGDHIFRLPFADLLPDLTPEESAALSRDIDDRGIQVPIMARPIETERIEYEGVTVLDVIDGQHRLRAALDLGIPFEDIPKTIKDCTPEEAAQLAFDLNVKRRQLSKDERDAAAVKLRQAGLSYRKIAASLGVSAETARRAALAAGDDAQPDQVTGSDGKKYESISEDTKIKRARELVLTMLQDGQTVNAAQLDDSPEFRKIGITARRILSILVGDGLITPDGNGTYKPAISEKSLDRVRVALQNAENYEATIRELSNITKIAPRQVNACLKRLFDMGEAARSTFGWRLSIPAINALADAPDPDRTLANVDGKPITAADIPDYDQRQANTKRLATAPAPNFATWVPSDGDLKHVRAAIRHTFYENPEAEHVTAATLSHKTGLKDWQVIRACTQMVADGLLTSPAYGKWTPTERNEAADGVDSLQAAQQDAEDQHRRKAIVDRDAEAIKQKEANNAAYAVTYQDFQTVRVGLVEHRRAVAEVTRIRGVSSWHQVLGPEKVTEARQAIAAGLAEAQRLIDHLLELDQKLYDQLQATDPAPDAAQSGQDGESEARQP